VSTPNFVDTLALLPLARRVGSYVYSEHRKGRTPIFDLNGITLSPPIPRSNSGVPCGGMGGGAIGRGVRGEFRRWSLSPGRYRHYVASSSVFGCRIDDTATVLSTEPAASIPPPLRCWLWGSHPSIDLASRSEYHALHPRSWSTFVDPTNSDSGITITERQISPIINDNYTDSSLPATVFEFTVENKGLVPKEVSVFFSFENTDGGDAKDDASHSALVRPNSGVVRKKAEGVQVGGYAGVKGTHVRHRKVVYDVDRPDSQTVVCCSCASDANARECSERDGQYDENLGISLLTPEGTAKVTTSRLTAYNPGDAAQNGALWRHFTKTGDLPQATEGFSAADTVRDGSNDRQSMAVCQRVTVQPGETETLRFSLAWDSPVAYFGTGANLPRRHSTFFPQAGNNDTALAAIALKRSPAWEQAITSWQAPILNNPVLPDWFKAQLYNELYYLSDGGGIWVDSTNGVSNSENGSMDRASGKEISQDDRVAHAEKKMLEVEAASHTAQGDTKIIGQFMYLEGHEYIMYNTSDVHFYASFALAANWPQVQLSVLRDYAQSVSGEDGEVRRLLGEGVIEVRKVKGALVHDLGSPCEHPILKVNAYNFQDVSRWKDLPCKFVLMIVRDVKDNMDFLRSVYPTAVDCMERASELWDKEGDGIIKNEGFPDQTYDVWIAEGVSAYTGGLWVAACFGMSRLAEMMGNEEQKIMYHERAMRGKQIYNDLLWNGEYFNYSERDKNATSIMADQLCGQWWTRLCDLPNVVDDPSKAVKTLGKVYDMNVLRWKEICGGVLNGAVNGMKPDGKVDGSCLQSKEVWTGTTYALASCMILESVHCTEGEEKKKYLMDAAFMTAKGVFSAGWERFGYSFATPEAWDVNGNYRSLGYMRPLSIWGMNYNEVLSEKKGFVRASNANR
jgi:non-lysosomal glucosylceramidase